MVNLPGDFAVFIFFSLNGQTHLSDVLVYVSGYILLGKWV